MRNRSVTFGFEICNATKLNSYRKKTLALSTNCAIPSHFIYLLQRLKDSKIPLYYNCLIHYQ